MRVKGVVPKPFKVHSPLKKKNPKEISWGWNKALSFNKWIEFSKSLFPLALLQLLWKGTCMKLSCVRLCEEATNPARILCKLKSTTIWTLGMPPPEIQVCLKYPSQNDGISYEAG